MIRIGVVEDDPLSRDVVITHLARYRADRGVDLDIATFEDGADLLAAYRSDFDVLLLDIEMERVSGMTAARRVRTVDDEVAIVFITAAPQYAISGYEVQALSYLLKPLSYAAFAQELDRVLSQRRRRERRTLLFQADGAHHRVDVADIVYLESAGHRVLVHTHAETHSVVSSLKALEAELDGAGFARCNSGYLVNLAHVTAVEQNEAILRGGARLQISRPKRKGFLAALADHIGQGQA